MSEKFLKGVLSLITETTPESEAAQAHSRRAFEDTLAVALAGWGEPVTRKVAALYGLEDATPQALRGASGDALAMLLGTAAHALDYDDVHQASSTHPSAPIVAALVAALQEAPELNSRAAAAFGVGLGVNVAIGRVLGADHYVKGWHATSTIGPMAAAAALANLYQLDATQAAHALAIAAAQAGGLQRNFGAMAKPLQAGLAAAAGWRGARLARTGFTADDQIFSDKGFFDLMRGEKLGENPDDVEATLDVKPIAVKLYPCCYATHRMIAGGLEMREMLAREGYNVNELRAVDVIGPPGAYLPLRVTDPQVGSEGKFCGPYTVACALTDGRVDLSHFEDTAVHRPELVDLRKKIRLVEQEGEITAVLRRGPMEMVAYDAGGQEAARLEVLDFPGSEDRPPTSLEMEAKVRDCLAHYQRGGGHPLDYHGFEGWVDSLLGQASLAAGA